MAGRPEGVAARGAPASSAGEGVSPLDVPTPSVAFGDISPSRGEITYPNFPVRGNPFGTIRPADALAPIHSASSSRERVNVRSAESCHDRPLASVKGFRSSRPPSLY